MLAMFTPRAALVVMMAGVTGRALVECRGAAAVGPAVMSDRMRPVVRVRRLRMLLRPLLYSRFGVPWMILGRLRRHLLSIGASLSPDQPGHRRDQPAAEPQEH